LCGGAVVERFGNAVIADEGVPPKVARSCEHLFVRYFFASFTK
jgi:hypothetical protein